MKKTALFSLFASAIFSASLQASVTMSVTFGAIYDHLGVDLGANKVGVLVLSTDGNFAGDTPGESGDLLGKSIAIGQSWGPGDFVVGILGSSQQNVTNDPKTPGFQFNNGSVVIDYVALGISPAAAGTKLGFYWFPSITDNDLVTTGIQFAPGANTIVASQNYGFYRSDFVANLGITGINSPTVNTAFVVPADGSTAKIVSRNVDALTSTQEGQMGANFAPTVADYTASLVVVPEPSTYALLTGFCAIGFALYRRRSSSKSTHLSS